MPPLHDEPLADSVQSLPVAATAMLSKKSWVTGESHPLAQSKASSPSRQRRLNRANSTTASLFASTITPPGSRPASPSGRASPSIARSVFGCGAFKHSMLDVEAADGARDPLSLILKSFVPHISICASQDVDDLAREKGFRDGLWELLRPFGEHVQGKVTVRDSNGSARPWENFSVRFTRFGHGLKEPTPASSAPGGQVAVLNGRTAGAERADAKAGMVTQVETVVDRHLRFVEDAYKDIRSVEEVGSHRLDTDGTSPYYALYLGRMLSGIPLAPHETFAHPVACVVAVSSRNESQIAEIRRIYDATSRGEHRLPVWVDGEYLRYYLLVHDEENSNIVDSMAMFEQMKRHFGLHCHLLRLRSSQSAETDDESVPLPSSDWISASEELAAMDQKEKEDEPEEGVRTIFESDITAIRTFVRELVTQSVLPTMERNVSVWNDQVASRRRGIGGRFLSLSKRLTFGAGLGVRTSTSGVGPASSNFDAQGFYRPETPEATMRRLADYAFMLRDWKLAMSTYDLLRSDFQNDKAWKYHAAANEMAALALLIMPQHMSSKTRVETINQMLEQAFYSYQTRCNSSYGAVRTVVLALELLRLRGGSGVDEAVRWGIRMLESKLMGPVGDALMKERLAVCYSCKPGTGSHAWGSRRRKSALWSVLGAESWLGQEKYIQAQRCLNEARKMYSLVPTGCGLRYFTRASEFMADLQARLNQGLCLSMPLGAEAAFASGDRDVEQVVTTDEEAKNSISGQRSRRASPVDTIAGGTGLETAPLTALTPTSLQDLPGEGENRARDDGST